MTDIYTFTRGGDITVGRREEKSSLSRNYSVDKTALSYVKTGREHLGVFP